jgi:hypothetical protein
VGFIEQKRKQKIKQNSWVLANDRSAIVALSLSPSFAVRSNPLFFLSILSSVVRSFLLFIPNFFILLVPSEKTTPTTVTMSVPFCPILTPTWDEFKDFYRYCLKIEPILMSAGRDCLVLLVPLESFGLNCCCFLSFARVGIVKVIPPKEFVASKQSYNIPASYAVHSPIRQYVQGKEGVYRMTNVVEQEGSLRCSPPLLGLWTVA